MYFEHIFSFSFRVMRFFTGSDKKKPCCLLFVFPFLISSMILLGCDNEADYKYVQFSSTHPVEQIQTSGNKKPILRVAIAAMVSPQETLFYYQALLDYIGEKLDCNIQLIQRKTYGEVNELFLRGHVDLAFICSGPYATGRKRYGFEALVTPLIRGKPFYHSYLIVQRDSPFETLESLRGMKFAFTDPESNSGSLVPSYWILKMGERPESFFGSIIYTYSHDNSMMAVSRSLIDGAAVDGHKWEYFNRKENPYVNKTRVIKKSIPMGSPPLVASALLPEEQRESIRELFLTMHQDNQGGKIMNGLMIDRFVRTDESWYDPVRMIAQVVQGQETNLYVSQNP